MDTYTVGNITIGDFTDADNIITIVDDSTDGVNIINNDYLIMGNNYTSNKVEIINDSFWSSSISDWTDADKELDGYVSWFELGLFLGF